MNHVLSNPAYRVLVRKRKRLSMVLSLIMLTSYVAFILLIAFRPAILGTPIAPDSPITLGIPIGLGLIFLAIILTALYTHFSNKVFDPLTAEARKALKNSK